MAGKAMRKQDIEIGKRAYDEVLSMFPMMKDAVAAIGCGNKAVYEWKYGTAPSATYLARLHELGADVIWILTGRRESDGEE